MSTDEAPRAAPPFRFHLSEVSPTASDATASLDLSMGVATDLLGSQWRRHGDTSPAGERHGAGVATPLHGGPAHGSQDDGDGTTTIVSESDAP